MPDEEKAAKKTELGTIWKNGVGTFTRTEKKPRKGTWLSKVTEKVMEVALVKQQTPKDTAQRAYLAGYILFQEPVADLTEQGSEPQAEAWWRQPIPAGSESS